MRVVVLERKNSDVTVRHSIHGFHRTDILRTHHKYSPAFPTLKQHTRIGSAQAQAEAGQDGCCWSGCAILSVGHDLRLHPPAGGITDHVDGTWEVSGVNRFADQQLAPTHSHSDFTFSNKCPWLYRGNPNAAFARPLLRAVGGWAVVGRAGSVSGRRSDSSECVCVCAWVGVC